MSGLDQRKSYFLCALLLALVSASHCNCTRPPLLCELYTCYHPLEEALLNDRQVLYGVRQEFFPIYGDTPDHKNIQITVVVDSIEPVKCDPLLESPPAFLNTNGSERSWTISWSTSAILALVTTDELLLFDSSLIPLTTAGYITGRVYGTIQISLHIRSLPCMPTQLEVVEALKVLIAWIKTYTRVDGGVPPDIWDFKEEDRGHVALLVSHAGLIDNENVNTQHWFRMVLLIMFVTLNTLVAALMVKFVPKLYVILTGKLLECSNNLQGETGKTSKQIASVYWASVFVITVYNVSNVIISILFYTLCLSSACSSIYAGGGTWILSAIKHPDSAPTYTDEEAIFLIRNILIPLLLLAELIVAACTPKDPTFPIPHKTVNILCCCILFPTRIQCKLIQTFALWHVMIFIQTLATAAIPLGVLLFASPVKTVSIVVFLVSLFLSSVLAVAHCLQLGDRRSRTRTPRPLRERRPYRTKALFKAFQSICIELVAIVSFFIFILMLFCAYACVLFRGVHRGGVVEIIATLIPSLILDVLMSWHMKRTFFTSHRNNNGVQLPLRELATSDEERGLLQPDHEDDCDNA